MRLNHYLTETEDIQPGLDLIRKQCGPFLKLMKSTGGILYRGVNEKDKTYLPIKKTMHREGRLPLSTLPIIHKALNEIFYKKFGWKVRDGVFATFTQADTHVYGNLYYVFGIGSPIRYCYSKEITDLWADLNHWTIKKQFGDKYEGIRVSDYIATPNIPISPLHREYLEAVVDKFYTDKGLVRFRGEVSFDFPNGYFIVRADGPYGKQIKEMIEG